MGCPWNPWESKCPFVQVEFRASVLLPIPRGFDSRASLRSPPTWPLHWQGTQKDSWAPCSPEWALALQVWQRPHAQALSHCAPHATLALGLWVRQVCGA